MKCAWKEFLSVLPQRMRQEVDMLGRDKAQELRLRLGKPAQLELQGGCRWLKDTVCADDISFVINAASRYSPWAAASARFGYITAPGGHRIGICGECVTRDGEVTGIRNATSLCIRVARDLPGLSENIRLQGSCLILGPPGSGKTTLMRDLIRKISQGGSCVSVVDERGELFPLGGGFEQGIRTDVLTGCSKSQGILMALKAMGPQWIAVDEITSQADCDALMQACWCGVRLLATAHAASAEDLRNRPVYKPLAGSGLFETLIILQQDKSFRTERIRL